jgi:uncharacterized protein
MAGSPNWTVPWKVIVDGVDMSDRMNEFLLSIEVTDKAGSASDTASLKFDDSDAKMFLPKDGAKVKIEVKGATIFEGVTDEIRSSGARGQGRLMSVSCKGMDSRGKVKEPLAVHKDNCTLQAFLDECAKDADIKSVTIDPEFKGQSRDYWTSDGESFLHLGQRIAEELGGSFKIRGDKAVLAKRGEGKTPGGKSMPTVTATWGVNLLSWEIAPFTGRGRYTKARVRYFDRKEAKYKEEEVEIKGKPGQPDATDSVRFTAGDKDQAKVVAKGRKAESEREGGEGTVRIDLDVTAQAEGTCRVVGLRPGVDGEYRIESVSHLIVRGSGSISTLELKQPQGSAGKDERKPKATGAAAAKPSASPGLTGRSNAAANTTAGTGVA